MEFYVHSVHGILQARILERVALPPPWNLPDPGIEHRYHALQTDSLPLTHWGFPKIKKKNLEDFLTFQNFTIVISLGIDHSVIMDHVLWNLKKCVIIL